MNIRIDSSEDFATLLVNRLDNNTLLELAGGYDNDIDKLLQDVVAEYENVLADPVLGSISSEAYQYVDVLGEAFNQTFRKINFLYFLVDVLPDFIINTHHAEWASLVQRYDRLSLLAARDHGKSFMFSVALPLWKMYRYERYNIEKPETYDFSYSQEGMVITSTATLGRKFLSMIKGEIESNPILHRALYNREKMGAASIVCANGAQLTTKAYGGSMRGYHPFYIVLDDFLRDNVLYSKDQRDKYNERFYSVISPMLVPGGQLINVGTPFHEDDLFGLLKKDPMFANFEYPAIFPNGSVLWDDRHGFDSLLRDRASMGEIRFTRERLVVPVSDGASIFPRPLIENAYVGMEHYTLVKNLMQHPLRNKFKRVVLGGDFAISANVGADYTVFVVLGIDEFENYWLLDVERFHGYSYGQQIEELKNMYQGFRFDIGVLESNGFQQIFAEGAQNHNLPVYKHTTTSKKNQLEDGLPSLAVLFEQGKIKFPNNFSDLRTKEMVQGIVSELASMAYTDRGIQGTGGHDDIVMALYMAILGCKKASFDYSM